MVRGSVIEYTVAIWERYRSGNKISRSKILNEFMKITYIFNSPIIKSKTKKNTTINNIGSTGNRCLSGS